jgi:inosine-uridine nucleoside N-ribohydrolase
MALVGSLGHAAPAAPAAAPQIASCTLIDTDTDTDFDLDDLMAIPLVIGERHVAAIVVTEGVVKADIGAAALAHLIAEPQQRQLPVIIGAATQVSEAVIDR